MGNILVALFAITLCLVNAVVWTFVSDMRFADLRKRRSQLAVGGGLPRHLEARRVVPVA